MLPKLLAFDRASALESTTRLAWSTVIALQVADARYISSQTTYNKFVLPLVATSSTKATTPSQVGHYQPPPPVGLPPPTPRSRRSSRFQPPPPVGLPPPTPRSSRSSLLQPPPPVGLPPPTPRSARSSRFQPPPPVGLPPPTPRSSSPASVSVI